MVEFTRRTAGRKSGADSRWLRLVSFSCPSVPHIIRTNCHWLRLVKLIRRSGAHITRTEYRWLRLVKFTCESPSRIIRIDGLWLRSVKFTCESANCITRTDGLWLRLINFRASHVRLPRVRLCGAAKNRHDAHDRARRSIQSDAKLGGHAAVGSRCCALVVTRWASASLLLAHTQKLLSHMQYALVLV